MMRAAIELAERRWLPDGAVRAGTRWLLSTQLAVAARRSSEDRSNDDARLLAHLRNGPIAIATAAANAQHYEVPSDFYRLWLGPRLKYSACWWPNGVATLAAAEEAMLALTAVRAQIRSGMCILDLGCGWGSFALWLAERDPSIKVHAVSNSHSQRTYIEGAARRRGLRNLTAETADVNRFEAKSKFDRVVSIEMFEHVRNHEALMNRIATWLTPGGKLFVHVFAHRDLLYLYETEGDEGWMGRHFFTGGMMPSHDHLPRLQSDMVVEALWRMSGVHYVRTLEAWLQRLDHAKKPALRVLAGVTDDRAGVSPHRLLQRWRMFLIASAELFGFDGGHSWGISHYRLAKRS